MKNSKKNPNWVYLIKFNYFKSCYKVGSTSSPNTRINALERDRGPSDIIIFGESKNANKVEQHIKKLLFQYSNYNKLKTNNIDLNNFVGPAKSKEHFVLDEREVITAKRIISASCDKLLGRCFDLTRMRKVENENAS